MRILVTNDDGVMARGLKVLERAARALSKDVWVVAPETEQSASAHSLSLHRPLRIRPISRRRYAVDGTPTDCVYLAFNKILVKNPPELVLSGVNRGSNIGEDVTYSGTVAAAMEAMLLGAPAIAFSQVYEDGERVGWPTAERWLPKVMRYLMDQGWPANILMNVNFPDTPPDKVAGIRACKQGLHEVEDMLEERIDPRGRPYYWVGMTRKENHAGAPGTDLRAISDGYVAVTPLHLDLTHKPTLKQLSKTIS